MSGFVAAAIVLSLIALAAIVLPLLRNLPSESKDAATSSNLALLREQLTDLELDLQNSTLSAHEYREARGDLERRALEEGGDQRAAGPRRSGTLGYRTAVVLGVAIPLLTGLIYWRLGDIDALKWSTNEGGALTMEVLTAQLATRLARNPLDVRGWTLLGRAYVAQQRYPDAVSAYERALAITPHDADLLVDYAESLATSQDDIISGKPLALVEQALKIQPNHLKALAMAGRAAFERKDYAAAADFWRKLKQQPVELDAELERGLDASIAEALRLAASTDKIKDAPRDKRALRGTVRLSPALSAEVNPTDTVFVYARTARGQGAPLAVIRRSIADLPLSFALDDSHSMTAQRKLSDHTDIIVGARVSKSGDAMPRSGDLRGASGVVKAGATSVEVIIDSRIP